MALMWQSLNRRGSLGSQPAPSDISKRIREICDAHVCFYSADEVIVRHAGATGHVVSHRARSICRRHHHHRKGIWGQVIKAHRSARHAAQKVSIRHQQRQRLSCWNGHTYMSPRPRHRRRVGCAEGSLKMMICSPVVPSWGRQTARRAHRRFQRFTPHVGGHPRSRA